MGDTNKQNDVLLNRVEELRQEKFKLNEELNNTRRETELFQEEKENLSLNYQNLLNIHNQMIQLDINRNEKNLKNSMHSVANSDIKSTPHNGKRSTAHMVEDENMKVLYESDNNQLNFKTSTMAYFPNIEGLNLLLISSVQCIASVISMYSNWFLF